MNGPERYLAAELLLQPTDLDGNRGGAELVQPSAIDVGLAQVHATLALAAATAGEWLIPVANGQHAQDFRTIVVGEDQNTRAAS